MELMQAAERAAEHLLSDAYRPIISWDGGEFFPMDANHWEENRRHYEKMQSRIYRRDHNGNPECVLLDRIPPEVFSRTIQHAGGDRHIWDEDDYGRAGERLAWWRNVVRGALPIRFVRYGPGGTMGLWIGGRGR